MSVFYNNALIGASGQATSAYQISRSVRLNSSDSAYFSRTPASAGNRKTWTWAGWVKRSGLGNFFCLMSAGGNDNFGFSSADKFQFYFDSGVYRLSTQVFRDVSAWYHLVVVYDSPNATAQNRIRVYVNGSEITAWDTNTTVSQNRDSTFNATNQHAIARNISATSQDFPGYLADVHFIDGQALAPTSFGEFDTNNVWQPKAYSGSYGTNGFHLDFADNSAATATTLGKDTSGNGNNWTPTNLSVTAGVGNDSLVDSPTNYGTDTGAGAEVRGNYATLNPLDGLGTASNGNLSHTSTVQSHIRATFGIATGKWYWEVLFTSGTFQDAMIGLARQSAATSQYPGQNTNSWGYFSYNGSKYYNGTPSAYGNTYTYGDVIGVAFDADNGKLWFAKNGVWQASGNPSSGTSEAFSSITSGPFFPAVGNATGPSSNTVTYDLNFGQRPFAYTAPSGFKALCTANLPTPTITKPSTVMDVVTYTGTGSTLTPTSTLGFSPDLVWIKSRSAATDHALYDAVRGAQARLESNNTDAEVTSDNGLTAFNSNGFTLGTLAQVNTNAATYAAWTWDAGSSTVTNTAGSISSQVRANPSAGFSVVTWTGNGSATATVGHGLNTAPLLYIVKRRDSTSNWVAFLTNLVAPSGGNPQTFLNLNNTDAAANASQALPSSTVLTVLSVFDNINSATYVAYCFAPVAGYSAFGTYTGNGSTDGPYIHLGFRPAFVIIKCSSASSTSWMSKDYKRAADYNPASGNLYLDATNAEDTINTVDMDFLANGIKLRGTYSGINSSSNTYIYAAWAQHPFALARAR